MYYSFRCTYCGRVYYTYSNSREQASVILYRAIKQHLIDYDEDRREYEMDDGEEMDSAQIYTSMLESKHRPTGGYEAPVLNGIGVIETSNHASSSSHSTSSTGLLIFLFLFLAGLFLLYYFVPEFQDFIMQFIPQL